MTVEELQRIVRRTLKVDPEWPITPSQFEGMLVEGEAVLPRAPPRAWRPPAVRGAGGMPWGERWLWGLRISGATVTVYPGTVRIGKDEMRTAETEVTIAADDDWIVWEYDPVYHTVTVKRWEGGGAWPVDHDGLAVGTLYQMGLESAAATLKKDLCHGVAYPPIFGP
jgi:hypothetical protein